jgi:hypothetical protein
MDRSLGKSMEYFSDPQFYQGREKRENNDWVMGGGGRGIESPKNYT